MYRVPLLILIYLIPTYSYSTDCDYECMLDDHKELDDKIAAYEKKLKAAEERFEKYQRDNPDRTINKLNRGIKPGDLDPTTTCPDPDISNFISEGGRAMTLEDLKIQYSEIFTYPEVIERNLENGTWYNELKRSEDGKYGIEIWVQQRKLWVRPVPYGELQQLAMDPGSIRVSSQWFCERPNLPKGTMKPVQKYEL